MLACVLDLWLVRWSVAGCFSLTEMDVPVLGVEVPLFTNVEKGVECLLSFLQAVRVWLVGVGPLGAVVDRE